MVQLTPAFSVAILEHWVLQNEDIDAVTSVTSCFGPRLEKKNSILPLFNLGPDLHRIRGTWS